MKQEKDSHVEDRLQAFLDGEMSERESDAVRRHCDVCLPCRRALDDWKRLGESMRSEACPEPMRPFWPAVQTRLHSRLQARVRLLLAFGTSIAAVLGFLLGIFVGGTNVPPPAGAPVETWSATGEPFSQASLLGTNGVEADIESEEAGEQQ
jgi:anti-sigma factor RsiW